MFYFLTGHCFIFILLSRVAQVIMLVGLAFAVLMSEISQPFSPLQLYVDPNGACCCLCRRSVFLQAQSCAIQGSDNNNGRSTATPLASCAGAIAAVAAELSSPQGLPPHGVDVTFAPGLYKYTTGTSCCISADCHGVNFTGTKEAPIVLHGARGDPTKVRGSSGHVKMLTMSRSLLQIEQVVFDGSVDVSSAELKLLPQNSTVATLINPAAVGKLYTMPMPMPPAGLEWNGVPLTPSQFPNKGLAYVRRVWDEGAVWAEGRTKGPKPTYNWTHPCGGNVSLAAPFPTGDWVAEFAAGTGFGQGAVRVSGYFSNDWYFETHDVARVAPSSAGTSIQLLDFSRYGLCEAEEDVRGDCGGQSPGRFKVYGLLSEVDMPGEYWYDTVAKVLYVYPPEHSLFTIADGAPALRSTPVISMRQAGTLASVVNASYLTIRDITATGSTATLVTIEGGDHNTIGGCILKNSDGGILLAGGHNNRIIGNDIYDVNGHLSSDSDPNGGDLEPTNNLIANNHLTQVFLRDTTWSVRISGVGDRFSHNLIHDAPQQVLMPKGPLTMVDHNEIFNTGYSDGDGGVIYAGASLVNGYGMHVRENFVHHSLDVPGLHGRGGIYFDDHFQAVTNASHNVLYKAAGRAFLVNGGGGSNITRNLIVNGGIGIFNQHADNITQALPLYDNGKCLQASNIAVFGCCSRFLKKGQLV